MEHFTGCGPAFVDLIIEALGDAGVKYGVPRKQAYEMVSQMIIGSAKLQLETGEHPGVLRIMYVHRQEQQSVVWMH